jgi:hypothetical protein
VRWSAIASSRASASVSPTDSGRVWSARIIVTSSRIDSSRKSPPAWSITPNRPSATAASGERPNTVTVPLSGRCRPSSRSIVVDLPALFGPSRATVSTASTCMSDSPHGFDWAGGPLICLGKSTKLDSRCRHASMVAVTRRRR